MIQDRGERISQPEWFRLCIDPEFKHFLRQSAYAFTPIRELQEDLCQEAYLAIGEAKRYRSIAYYRKVAVRAMDAYRKREARYFRNKDKIIELMKWRVLMGEPLYGRSGRPLKKLRFFIKNPGEKDG